MKRLLSFLLMLVLILSMALPTFAAEGPYVQPRYKHIATFSAEIEYGNWGIATCRSVVTIDDGYQVTLTMSLQQSSGNDSWKDVKTWTDQGYSGASITQEYSLLNKYSYRVLATATVYDLDGNWIETETQMAS